MTALTRKVKRETAKHYRTRALCIELSPLYLEMWEKGRRDRVTLDYATLYEFCLKLRWRQAQAEKAAAKKEKGHARRKR